MQVSIIKSIERCVVHLRGLPEVHQATIYLSPVLTVKATRQGKCDRRSKSETFIVTIGTPNYLERKFIRECKAAGEPFPVRKVQLKYYPTPKKKKAA